jgi:hypothetical protein
MASLPTSLEELRQALERGTAPGPWLDPGAGGYTQLDAAGYQQMLREASGS